ncbi:MAG: CHAT domain-containing protein [Vicinamibacterales bacterium]
MPHPCPSAQQLAAYADNTLDPASRRAIEAHLADCATCRYVLMETVEHVDAPVANSGGRRVWPVLIPIGIAAALLLVAVRLWNPSPVGAGRPELRALETALSSGPTRLVEGRLDGAYGYMPAPPATRGVAVPSVPPEVQIAAATIERAVSGDDTSRAYGALGVSYLVRGDVDRAIDALQDAVRREPNNASFQNDLAVAFLARARTTGAPMDWVSALAAANRALALGNLDAALFNKALALEGARLTQQAIDAWKAYQERDRDSGWSQEAARHVQALSAVPQGQNQDTGPADLQTVRERAEHEILRDWGAAVLANDAPKTRALFNEAEAAAARIARDGGDGMASDAVARIRRATDRPDEALVRALAAGHEIYGRAREALQRDDQQIASDLMAQAAAHFSKAGSPYRLWDNVFRAILLRNQGRSQDALDTLARVDQRSLPPSFTHLRARIEWATGVALDEQGRYDLGIRHLARAVALFTQSSERANLAATQTILAEAEWALGDHSSAWRHVFEVQQDVALGRVRPNFYHLAIAGRLALSADLPEAAIEFEGARIAAVTSARTRTEAYMRRARTHVALGNLAAAEQDLAQAAAAVEQITDAAIRERNAADVSISRAELLSQTDSVRAIDEATKALETVPRLDPALRLARLLALRARAYEAIGKTDEAKADLVASLAQFEQKRANLDSVDERLRAFDGERPIFKQFVQLEAGARQDHLAALRMAERSRNGGWQKAGVSLDPSVDHRQLPPNTAVIVYEVLDERVLSWVLTRERVTHLSYAISRDALALDVARVERAIGRGARVAELAPLSTRIHSGLIAPALASVPDGHTVYFVPDGALSSLPFAAIPGANGQPVISRHIVGIATSFTDLIAGSNRLTDFDAGSVLAVGDGHDPEGSRLPRLPLADSEATAVGQLYPRRLVLAGATAVATRLLTTDAQVIHFAGHTIVNREFPLLSRLLLAPEEGNEGDGALLASAVLSGGLPRTRVVVLATCDAAAPTVMDGEGVLSVARVFLAAGVPAVIASMWPVEDDNRGLMARFHQELRTTRRPAEALRNAQLAVLKSDGELPVRTWAGFVALGGMSSQK